MKYRLTRFGKFVVYSFSFILATAMIIIIVFNYQKYKLDGSYSSNPVITPTVEQNSEPNNNTDKLSNNTEDSALQPDISTAPTPTPTPEIVEVTNNIELQKNTTLSIYFGPNISKLEENYYSALDLFAEIALTMEGTPIRIEGNCATTTASIEDVKNDPFTYKLSLARAEVVADYLKSKGIDARRIIVIGNGANKPVKDNSTYENRKFNRRADISFQIIEK